MYILKWNKKVSGLDINCEKRKVANIRSIPWEGKFGFEWTNTFEILGIPYNNDYLVKMTEASIDQKIGVLES